MMRKALKHRLEAAAALAGCAVLAPLALAGPAGASVRQAASTSAGEFGFTAAAYGTAATAAGKIVSAASAAVSFSCLTTSRTESNSATGADIGLGNSGVGAVTNQVSRTDSGSTSGASATSTTQSVNLLGGLIKAGSVTDKASASETSGTWGASGSATFTGLTIGGKSEAVNPAPNTPVNLAGIGTAYLNYQVKSVSNTGASMSGAAILVEVKTQNTLGVPVGATIVVGRASVTGAGPLSGTLSGSAYGASASGPVGTLGQSFLAVVDCMGASSNDSSGSGVTLGPVSTGAINDTATGTDNATTLSAMTSSTVSNVNVTKILSFGGVKANASASKAGGKITVTGRVTLSNPKLLGAGVPVLPANPPANYTVKVPGGTLTLNRQVKTATGITVQAVYLNVSSIGTVVIGAANAGVGS